MEGPFLAEGKMIVLAGIDGSGKATQTDLLVRRLENGGRSVETFDFPQYEGTFFGRLVARYLRGEFGEAANVSPYLASLLYAGDRWQARERIARALRGGRIVVCNRYVSANMAHQGGKIADAAQRRRFYDWVLELEHEVFALPRPDLCVFLDVPVEVASGLVGDKSARAYLNGESRDIHERDAAHLHAARNAYLEISEIYPNWGRIPCATEGDLLPPEAIAEKVWRAVAGVVG